MASDKRRTERFSANLFAELSSANGEAAGRGVVIDVSLSGVAVETEGELNVGEEVQCHIEIPLRFTAKVMRIMSEGNVRRYGLQFTDQSFLDKMLLKKILKGQRQSRKV